MSGSMTSDLEGKPLPGGLTLFIRRAKKYVVEQWARDSADPLQPDDFREEADLGKANVVSSLVEGPCDCVPAVHRPVIDIDFPVYVVQSTSPRHHHLYIDKELTPGQYFKLLDVMVEVGIVQAGYVAAARRRGATMVRLPWVRKE